MTSDLPADEIESRDRALVVPFRRGMLNMPGARAAGVLDDRVMPARAGDGRVRRLTVWTRVRQEEVGDN